MSPKLQNDHYSQITQIKKMNKIKDRPEFKNDPNLKMTKI